MTAGLMLIDNVCNSEVAKLVADAMIRVINHLLAGPSLDNLSVVSSATHTARFAHHREWIYLNSIHFIHHTYYRGWRFGFGVEVFSWLGVVDGSVTYGLALVRAPTIAPWIALLVILGGLLMLVMFFDRSVIMYMPNAQTSPLVLAWMILGVRLILHPTIVYDAQADRWMRKE